MTILILTNKASGLYDFRKELLYRLNESSDVIVCAPKDERTDDIKKIGCEYVECTVLDRRGVNPITDLKLERFYVKIIKEYAPDIVLTYTIKPNIYGGIACKTKKVPYISNITGLGTSIENGGILSKIAVGLYKIGLKHAACVIFQNKSNQELCVKKKIAPGRTRVVAGSGVNLTEFHFEEYPKDDGCTRFLFVGRIMKDKGIEELLSAIREIRENNKTVQLDVVGWGDEDYSSLIEEAEQNGTIVFHGFQQDVHLFYKAAHCIILPSYHEGMSNVLLEAAATGRPVITTRIPGCQEAFEEGVTGFGCEAKDADSLTKAIQTFLTLSRSERENMGKAARDKMEREFDRDTVINAYVEEISKATKRSEADW